MSVSVGMYSNDCVFKHGAPLSTPRLARAIINRVCKFRHSVPLQLNGLAKWADDCVEVGDVHATVKPIITSQVTDRNDCFITSDCVDTPIDT